MIRRGAKGIALCYRNKTPIGKIKIFEKKDKSDPSKPCFGVEILGTKNQMVAYGLHPDTNELYQWPNEGFEPALIPYGELPEVTPDQLRELADRIFEKLVALGYRMTTVAQESTERHNEEPGKLSDADEITTMFYDQIVPRGAKKQNGWYICHCPVCNDVSPGGKGAFLITSDGGWRYKCWKEKCEYAPPGTGWSPGRDLGEREKELYRAFGGNPDELPRYAIGFADSEFVENQYQDYLDQQQQEQESDEPAEPDASGSAAGIASDEPDNPEASVAAQAARDSKAARRSKSGSPHAGEANDDEESGDHFKTNEAPPVLSPSTPSVSAREFIKRQPAPLRFWRDDFYRWVGTHYEKTDDAQIRAEVYRFLDHALTYNGKPFKTSKNKVSEVIDALKALVLVFSGVEPGAESDRIVFKNGVFRLSTKKLEPHDPQRFSLTCLPFDYDPSLPPPTEWLQFLRALWPSRDDYIRLLQEVFGYHLSGRTDLQKIFLLIGPPRSGKGTIAFALRTLLGKSYVADITMDKFGKDFGMQVLIGKTALIIPDARQGRLNLSAVTERLLNISGEDPIAISRKYKEDWQGMLGTRIMIMSNEVPRLPDPTGTIATRFVPIIMFISFLGREDIDLKKRLIPELPQITNWALQGLDRLDERGHFVVPEESLDTIDDIKQAATPLIEFKEDYLVIDHDGLTFKQRVYDAYRGFALSKGYEVMSDGRFGRELRGLIEGLEEARPRVNGEPGPRMWKGIRLADPNSPKFMSPYNDDEGEVYVPPGKRLVDEIFH